MTSKNLNSSNSMKNDMGTCVRNLKSKKSTCISIKEFQKQPGFIEEINKFLNTTKKIYKIY